MGIDIESIYIVWGVYMGIDRINIYQMGCIYGNR